MKKGSKAQPRILFFSPFSNSEEPVIYTLDKNGNLTKEATELMKSGFPIKEEPCQIIQDNFIDPIDDSYTYINQDLNLLDCTPNFGNVTDLLLDSKDYISLDF
ncbi:hypothetical protein TVAG_312460 [Trichomonas vaginalis G3]|uniref:Uncharacterized protein n=1 Tax=Trichomonas vaginalis (strain ATCC PRA-98 / G3) TaxID=412133 RepID=A2EHQ1_TRIV3|nr:hypothetical protein TVAGG3_0242730 [Trichomonas vaginalis G3]EAY07847.1 hypothetical protein TVAG_312460 [Trichomonas vaginalis G3]KAI5553459.1 hypothetical protein TVAGG3_0242730 [Trichomonas vaginalis G3]|eukprot:XP_001320070.1 hypothetical protein [Trichomonas vaginalis G3]